MVAVAGSVFRYCFKVDGRVVHCGFTTDLARREREHRRRWPTGRIEQVGGPTAREEAWKWGEAASRAAFPFRFLMDSQEPSPGQADTA